MAGSWVFQGRVPLVFGGVLDHQKCYRNALRWVGCEMHLDARNSENAAIGQETSDLGMSTLVRQRL